MKRVLIVCMVILAMLTQQVFAQGSSESDGAQTIAFVPKQFGNPYFVAINDAVKEAAEANGFIFKSNAPDSSIEVDKQISIVEAFIAQGVDYLIIIPNDSMAIVNSINTAAQQGIPVFLRLCIPRRYSIAGCPPLCCSQRILCSLQRILDPRYGVQLLLICPLFLILVRLIPCKAEKYYTYQYEPCNRILIHKPNFLILQTGRFRQPLSAPPTLSTPFLPGRYAPASVL